MNISRRNLIQVLLLGIGTAPCLGFYMRREPYKRPLNRRSEFVGRFGKHLHTRIWSEIPGDKIKVYDLKSEECLSDREEMWSVNEAAGWYVRISTTDNLYIKYQMIEKPIVMIFVDKGERF